MLSDFLEASEIKAELVKLSRPVSSLSKAIQLIKASKSNAVKATLLVDGKGLGVLCVHLFNSVLDLEKAGALAREKLFPAGKEETEEVTGYREEFLPPISVYGVQTLIDKKVMQRKTLFASAGTVNQLMKISPEELLKAAFEPAVEEISK